MSLQIEHSGDVTLIAPILRVLRNALTEDVFEARLARAIQGGLRVLIAQDTGDTLGCLGYRVCDDVFWGKTLYIDDLVVRPETRGKGVGAALLGVVKKEAGALNCDHIRLCSGLNREQAHLFYEQNGFGKSSIQFFYAVPDGEN